MNKQLSNKTVSPYIIIKEQSVKSLWFTKINSITKNILTKLSP